VRIEPFDASANPADTDDRFVDDDPADLDPATSPPDADGPPADTGNGLAAMPGPTPQLRVARAPLAVVAESATARGWGPGWPHPQTDRIVVAVCGHNNLRLPVRREIAPLVQRLVADLEQQHGPFHDGWCWGFANRAIRGSSTPSNHSWGLAVDLDAPLNPMTSDPRASHTIGSYASGVAARYGFRWGGDYRGRKDFMHFEFLGTPQSAAGLAGSAGGTGGTGTGGTGRPGSPMPYPGRTLQRGSPSGPAVWAVQEALARAGVGYTAGRGPFGPRTDAAVRAFQAASRLVVDGVVGPRTWTALHPAVPAP